MVIDTLRTRLRCLRDAHREVFAAMHAHPEVMRDLGGPISRAMSDAKLDRYVEAFERHGLCRWAVESRDERFLGYAGVMPSPEHHPLGPHFEIGWRLVRSMWGYGYATEAAKAALCDAFVRAGLREILAYTAADNLRSQSVMRRLGLERHASRDFTATYDGARAWSGLVWVAQPA
jgi:RimJ/RimL family protein N-acetyltransferase